MRVILERIPHDKLNTVFEWVFVSGRASTLSSAVSSLSSTGMSFSRMDEKEKQQALEEEQARLQALKVGSFLFDKSPLHHQVVPSAVAVGREQQVRSLARPPSPSAQPRVERCQLRVQKS